MNEDFVTYELAKKLKRNGFDKDTAHYYNDEGQICVSLVDEEYPYPCPTISQALKWLREEKKIHLEISFWHTTETWSCKVVKITNLPDGEWEEHRFDSWKNAVLKGIEYVLKYWI